MPELPEVETVRRQLDPWLTGRRAVGAWGHGSPKFASAPDAVGPVIQGVGRRGKYLLVGLDDGRELVVHLGMTGQLRPRPGSPAGPDTAGVDPFVRAWWALDDGRVAVVPAGDHRSLPTLHALGPEPLGDGFTADGLWRALGRSRIAVKTQLLGQRVVAGVGNIYADEALWRARVNPAARAVGRERCGRLHSAIRDVLAEAVDHGGTTVRDYRTVSGDEGGHQHHLDCYGRAGEPCHRCGTTMRGRMLGARGTTWCPVCQSR